MRASATLSANGPRTTATAVFARTFPSSVQTAPVVPHARPPPSVTVTSSQPVGLTVIRQPMLEPCCSRLALRTAPPVAASDCLRSVL